MARFVKRRWEGDPGAVGGRRDRQPFTYDAFIPDEIADLDPQVPFQTATLALDAEQAIRELNARALSTASRRSDRSSCDRRRLPHPASRATR